MKHQTIYLDYAAATPVNPQVLAAMQPYFTHKFHNPSATYGAAVSVRNDLQAARGRVAAVLGAKPSEVTFVAGATEANNLAIRGVLGMFPEGNIVVSSIEHDSVLEPARLYPCKEAPVMPNGIIDINNLADLIDDRTVMVSVMYGNNEVGTVQPLKDIAQLITRIRLARREAGNVLPVYLHTDAAQAGNYLDLHVSRLGVDFMTLNGGKIYGPKQSGVLFAASHTRFAPQIIGGGQEMGRRGGTENVAASIGFAAALEAAQAARAGEVARLKDLQALFITLIKQHIPDAVINGSRKLRLPNNVHVSIPGRDNERVLIRLDEAGVMAAAGSACSASNQEPSHVLKAMGLSDDMARSSLRFTMGRQTTEDDVRRTVEALASVVARYRD